MTEAPRLPGRVTILGGELAFENGEWFEPGKCEHSCRTCNVGINWGGMSLTGAGTLCPACCAALGGHAFTIQESDGVFRCWHCGLYKPGSEPA